MGGRGVITRRRIYSLDVETKQGVRLCWMSYRPRINVVNVRTTGLSAVSAQSWRSYSWGDCCSTDSNDGCRFSNRSISMHAERCGSNIIHIRNPEHVTDILLSSLHYLLLVEMEVLISWIVGVPLSLHYCTCCRKRWERPLQILCHREPWHPNLNTWLGGEFVLKLAKQASRLSLDDEDFQGNLPHGVAVD
jgi:hypothetical protein